MIKNYFLLFISLLGFFTHIAKGTDDHSKAEIFFDVVCEKSTNIKKGNRSVFDYISLIGEPKLFSKFLQKISFESKSFMIPLEFKVKGIFLPFFYSIDVRKIPYKDVDVTLSYTKNGKKHTAEMLFKNSEKEILITFLDNGCKAKDGDRKDKDELFMTLFNQKIFENGKVGDKTSSFLKLQGISKLTLTLKEEYIGYEKSVFFVPNYTGRLKFFLAIFIPVAVLVSIPKSRKFLMGIFSSKLKNKSKQIKKPKNKESPKGTKQ